MEESKLRKLLRQEENELIEYKKNNKDPIRIGKYISALANSSAMIGKQFSYMFWGIEDATQNIVGTSFSPYLAKKGGIPLITYLEKMLDPRINIHFEDVKVDGLKVVVLIIHMTAGRPVAFDGERYIRSGSSVKNLSEFPEKENYGAPLTLVHLRESSL